MYKFYRWKLITSRVKILIEGVYNFKQKAGIRNKGPRKWRKELNLLQWVITWVNTKWNKNLNGLVGSLKQNEKM